MMRRVWAAATVAVSAAVAAIYLLSLVFQCKFSSKRGTDQKDKHYLQGDTKSSNREHTSSDVEHSIAEPQPPQQHGPAHAAGCGSEQQNNDTTVGECAMAQNGDAPGSDGASSSQCADEAAPVDSAAVDVGYLQGLLDEQLGTPKFAVPKQSPDAPPQSDSLQALLDKEFGPPKFAVQKVQPTGAAPANQGMPRQPAGRRLAAERPKLQLSVTDGPAAGTTVQSTDDQAEITIGRLPASTLSIVDQEVSGRHAVIQFDEDQECWKVMDAGSLNGSMLNGITISSSNREPGKQHTLEDQDVLQLGGITKIRVTCSQRDAEQPSKRHAPEHAWSPGSPVHAKLPAPQHIEVFPSLGLRMVIHQRTGTDHQRNNTAMEDVVHYQCPFEPFGEQAALLCVFDGHHGSQAAKKAKSVLPLVLVEKLLKDGTGGLIDGRSPERQQQLLREVFLETDARLASDEGCTATTLLLQQGAAGQLSVQAANVGDSSALVVNLTTNSWCKLTADHRIANSTEERERLQERGHTVKRRLYGLNISRMLGDKFLKDEDLGFIAEPHVSHVEHVAADHRAFIIMASDGLWDVLSEERAAGLVLKAYAAGPEALSAELVADLMLSQALTLRSQDDISVVVVDKQDTRS